MPARTRERLVIGSYSYLRIGIEVALSLLSEAAAIAAETDSAANQFGAHGRARRTPARHISVFVACGCPSHPCRISG